MVRLWVGEGLVEEKPGHVVEDIAEEYFEQLVSLGLLKTVVVDYSDCFGYHVPEPLHFFLVDVMKEQDFVIASSYEQPNTYPLVRRVKHDSDNEAIPFLNNPLIRSLFIDGICCPGKLWPCSGFKLLRVLELEGLKMKKLGKGVGNLRHLKSLSFKYSTLEELPEDISNLGELQTLDIRWCSNISSVPDWILKNAQLRNLLMSHCQTYGVKLPVGMEMLKNLQNLEGVNASSYATARGLTSLTQLRELDLCNFSEGYSTELYFTSIMQMRGLLSLSLMNSGNHRRCLVPILDQFSPPPLLRKLLLEGRLTSLPEWISSVENLTQLRLESYLSGKPSVDLQFLPNLKHLTLRRAYRAKCIGKEFIQAGGFPKLELFVYSSEYLVEWTEIEQGSFPCLKYLCFRHCPKLMLLPEGLQNVTTLQVLNMNPLHADHARRLLSAEGKENYKIKHIPEVRHYLKKPSHE